MAIETKNKKDKISKYEGPKNKKKLEIKRHFTSIDNDPYDSVEWEIRNAVAGDFEQKGVEAPICWSDNAVGIVSKLYFATIEGKRESSVKTLIKRVVRKITDEGINHGYFDEVDACTFEAELTYILINQIAAFNTPVWINLGVPARKQCCSACYLLNVEDTMFGEDSITDWWVNEAAIFKTGAGSGINLSKIRGSMEPISAGGIASGPVSFMRVADANAGTIKSGSVARRAAKLVCLDVDHPDILDFIDCKVREDERMRALMAAGINLDPSTLEGEKSIAECTSFQNANISVRLSDEFMKAVGNEEEWELIPRTLNSNVTAESAKEILYKIAEAAWKCADPGVMFDDTINEWHTTPSLGRINTSNPCGETQLNDNTSCNLASLNLVKFLNKDNSFKFKDFNQVVDTMITAMDITCSFSELPTKKLEENTRNLRQLGLGYSNLGAALMIQGMPYDSDEGRDWAASVTSLMTARAYRRSAELASSLGDFFWYKHNHDSMNDVILKHRDACYNTRGAKNDNIIWGNALDQWDYVAHKYHSGFRNSQVTVIAPTGCLTPDTMVLSSKGLVPIGILGDSYGETWQDIDLEIAQENDYEKANKFFVNGEDEVYRLVSDRGHEICGTWKHQLRVIDDSGQYIWRQMQDIMPEDILVMSIGGHEGILEDKEYLDNDKFGKLDEEFAEVLGYYIGDGYVKSSGGLHMVINDIDDDVKDWFFEWGENQGYNVTFEQRKGCEVLTVNDRQIALAFRDMGYIKQKGNRGEGAAAAEIPLKVLESRSSVLIAFLRGLFEADGTVSFNRNKTPTVSLVTVSGKLARQVHTSLESLGIRATTRIITDRKSSFGERPLFNISLSSIEDTQIFSDKIGFISSRKQNRLESSLEGCKISSRGDRIKHQKLIDDFYDCSDGLSWEVRQEIATRKQQGSANLSWIKEIIDLNPQMKASRLARLLDIGDIQFVKVKSIDNIGLRHTVDISVPRNNTYIANGFVSHNTISFMMDCDTTGAEPAYSLVTYKKLASGGTMTLVNKSVAKCLENQGFIDSEIKKIEEDGLSHYIFYTPYFQTATRPNSISSQGHIKMLAAIQPHISGAISKTVNLSQSATVEDIYNLYLEAWKMGIKCLAIYRDGSKATQVLSSKDDTSKPKSAETEYIEEYGYKDNTEEISQDEKSQENVLQYKPLSLRYGFATENASKVASSRKRLNDDRTSLTHKFSIGDHEGYITAGMYEDGTLGEIFLSGLGKEGSTLKGVLEGWAIAISMGLQHGVPLESFARKFSNMSFEPRGLTSNCEIRNAHSILDYVMRWLISRFGEHSLHQEFGIMTDKVKEYYTYTSPKIIVNRDTHFVSGLQQSGKLCSCGAIMNQTGTCYTCSSCGFSSGCG